jgi:outer membrane murein-binding lipoprotein Lpp
VARFIVSVGCALLLAGCGSNAQRVATENDRLRSSVADLQDDVAALEARNTELEAEMAAQNASEPARAVAEEIRLNTPRVASVDIGRLSHLVDDDGDGVPDTAVLYIEPRDGRGRFIQIVGNLDANVALVPAQGDAMTLGRVRLAPAPLRDAYRSSFTGTHYTIRVPLEVSPGSASDLECAVRITFHDGLSGRDLTASRMVTSRVLSHDGDAEDAP